MMMCATFKKYIGIICTFIVIFSALGLLRNLHELSYPQASKGKCLRYHFTTQCIFYFRLIRKYVGVESIVAYTLT